MLENWGRAAGPGSSGSRMVLSCLSAVMIKESARGKMLVLNVVGEALVATVFQARPDVEAY